MSLWRLQTGCFFLLFLLSLTASCVMIFKKRIVRATSSLDLIVAWPELILRERLRLCSAQSFGSNWCFFEWRILFHSFPLAFSSFKQKKKGGLAVGHFPPLSSWGEVVNILTRKGAREAIFNFPRNSLRQLYSSYVLFHLCFSRI